MNEIVTYVVADRHRSRQVLVGESIGASVPPAAIDVPVTIELPSGDPVPRRVPPRDEVGTFLFDDTTRSGLYRIQFGPPVASDETFAVNIDAQESDLAKLQRDELQQLLPSWRFEYLTNWQAIATGKSSAMQNRGELHRYFLYLALVLALVESFLAWRFGHYN